MLLKIVRLAFVLLAGVLAWYVTRYLTTATGREALLYGLAAAAAAAALVGVDVAFRQHLLRGFVAVVFGIIAGILVSLFLMVLVGAFLWPTIENTGEPAEMLHDLIGILQPVVPLVVLAACYLTVSVVLRTKDEFRFIIPYVDFAEQGRKSGGIILDSSVLIDGRIVEISEKLLLNDPLIIPRFVVAEMQRLADGPERLARERGRRGLDMVGRLQANPRLRFRFHEEAVPGVDTVDAKLVRMAQMFGARLATNDFNLAKVARIEKVEVININELAGALRVPYLPGEELDLRVVRPGEQRGQGVGYLDDGTMVVVENAREDLGKQVRAAVTNSLQTPAGRMIFARKAGEEAPGGESGKKPDSRRLPRER